MRYVLDTNILCKQDTYAKARTWILQHYLQIGISSVTALANKLEVVTENVADFPGLKVINPLKA